MHLKHLLAAALLSVSCSIQAEPSPDPVAAATPLELEALGRLVDRDDGGRGEAVAALLALQEISRQLQRQPETAPAHADTVMKLSLLVPVSYPPGMRVVEPPEAARQSAKTVSQCIAALQQVTYARDVASAICATGRAAECAGALVSVAAATTSAVIACGNAAYELK